MSESNSYYLDTDDRLLAQWVKQSLKSDSHQTHNVYVPVVKWVNQCIYDSGGPTSNVLYTVEPDFRRHPEVNKKISAYSEKSDEQNARKTVDANGNVSVQKKTIDLPDFVFSPSHSKHLYQHPQWAALIALALPKGEAVIEKLTSEIPNKIRQAAVQENQKNITRIAKEEKNKRAKEKAISSVDEYINTPDGTLFLSYMYYSRIKTCIDARDGYLAVYLTPKQYSKAKSKIKKLEQKLEPKLTENKDALWNRAVKSRLEYILGEWRNGLYLGVENYEFNVAKDSCYNYNKIFNALADNMLGDASVEKGF